MKSAVSQRIKELALFKEQSIKAFAEAIGMPQTTVNNYVIGSRVCSFELIKKIADTYSDVSLDWLVSGKGKMIASDVEKQEQPQITKDLIPEVSFSFAAGQKQLVNGKENINRYWYLPDCADCDAVVPIEGDSMSPNMPPGSFAVLKRFHVTANNPNSIPFGQVFGIVVEDEATGDYHGYVKVLRKHKDTEQAKQCWIAHSYNPDYDDFDIHLSQVRSLWIVKQYVVSSMAY